MAKWLEAKFSKKIGNFRIDLELAMDREIGVLFGPSGSGKSQTLRILAGLSHPDEGTITLGSRELVRLPGGNRATAASRKIGLVFQDLALFPHLTVWENVAYGLPGPETRARSLKWLKRCHLDDLENRFPHQLSGGQKQRVALARALAPEPDLLLLDEPFSALDGPLRSSLRRELKRLHRETGTPVLYVTHHIEDVCALGDRIFFLKEGQLSCDMPVSSLWESSAQGGLWGTLGWGNLIHGEVESREGGLWIVWPGGSLELPPSTKTRGPVTAFIAPYHLKILYPDLPVAQQLEPNVMEGTVVERLDLGSTKRIYVSSGGFQWQLESSPLAYEPLELEEGTSVRFAVMPRNICLLGRESENGNTAYIEREVKLVP